MGFKDTLLVATVRACEAGLCVFKTVEALGRGRVVVVNAFTVGTVGAGAGAGVGEVNDGDRNEADEGRLVVLGTADGWDLTLG